MCVPGPEVPAIREYVSHHPEHAELNWVQLPASVRLDVQTRGSPGWVRCQSVFIHRILIEHCHGTGTLDISTFNTDRWGSFAVMCPYVDSHVIVESFNRFRRQSRGTSLRMVNPQNTIRSAPLSAAAEADDAAEAATASALSEAGGNRGCNVGLNQAPMWFIHHTHTHTWVHGPNTRMNLDATGRFQSYHTPT